ncbi:hypothetical protein WMO40_16240 [Bacillaceae bacterium CLA-AA-H227]|uniref:Uncharacterized protein n=1 Tax=Robertmurraya yapensis (ex Hitch et al 2024) TaxID=3133160 RepID=A0ACC6SDS3_9BACI
MLKKIYLILGLCIVIMGCSNKTSDVAPNDFNFSLSYGTYGKQKIDTFNDIVVKDLIEDGTMEVQISLSDDELKQIYEEMMKIDIMGDLDIEKSDCISEPPHPTEWEIQMNGQRKTISYSDYCDYPKDVENLIELKDFIHQIVSSKDQYNKLPEARGGYK